MLDDIQNGKQAEDEMCISERRTGMNDDNDEEEVERDLRATAFCKGLSPCINLCDDVAIPDGILANYDGTLKGTNIVQCFFVYDNF